MMKSMRGMLNSEEAKISGVISELNN